MHIRGSDKKLICYMAMMGALAGAYLAVLSITDVYSKAQQEYRQEWEFVNENRALMNLQAEHAALAPQKTKPTQDILDAAKIELLEHHTNLLRLQNQFWVRTSIWVIVGLCIVAGVGGLMAGYGISWGFLWLVSMGMYKIIRSMYAMIHRFNPDIYRTGPDGTVAAEDQPIIRNAQRVLPRIVKFVFLILITSILLGLLIMNDFYPFVR